MKTELWPLFFIGFVTGAVTFFFLCLFSGFCVNDSGSLEYCRSFCELKVDKSDNLEIIDKMIECGCNNKGIK